MYLHFKSKKNVEITKKINLFKIIILFCYYFHYILKLYVIPKNYQV